MYTPAKKLLKKYLDGTCSEHERAIVETWYNRFELLNENPVADAEQLKDIHAVIKALDRKLEPVHVINWRKRLAVAASILLIAASGLLFRHFQPSSTNYAVQNQKNDIQPGRNQAVLTLANGTKIVLANAKTGKLARQNNAILTKTVAGKLVYQLAKSAGNVQQNIAYNTVTTPRGGEFQLMLADGTNVWLNAASSITYPTAFAGQDRQVRITGEAYFEVAHNAAMPFRVIANGQIVQVLGTHFDINAYPDEPVLKTTLLEGSVKITRMDNHLTECLKPGEQAVIDLHHQNITVSNVNTDDAVAWKNGLFSFRNESVQGVMRQLSRWYDVDVVYAGALPKRAFSGNFYRSLTAAQALELLSFTKVHFQIKKADGGHKKIEVTP